MIGAGMETGEVTVYDPVKILAGDGTSSQVFKVEKHTGPVRGLDFNPIQKNLLLSGGINAEVGLAVLGGVNNSSTLQI